MRGGTANLRFRLAAMVMVVAISSVRPATAEEGLAASWPQFRGPQASGRADGPALPPTWDVRKGDGVLWKTPIAGLGHSSPALWGDKLVVTTAEKAEGDSSLRVGLYGDIAPVDEPVPHRFKVICLDRRTGKPLWEHTAHEGVPKVKRHTKATHANCTAALNDRCVVAFFGSEGLYCYDHAGKLLWSKDLGVLDSGFHMVPGAQWGFGSSPVIHEDRVIVQCDVQKDSFVAAYALKDGQELWRTPRDEVPTWSTPTVVKSGDRTQVLCNGYRCIAGYDVRDGKELWRMRGAGGIPVPTPIVGDGLFFFTSNHSPAQPIYAVKAGAKGDISLEGEEEKNEFVAWFKPRRGNYMQTPILLGERLYLCADAGLLTCFEAATGKQLYRERLGKGGTGFTASPVAAGGRLYYTSEEGDVFVVKDGPTFELLATNPIGEVCMATPAIVDGVLYVRTQNHIIAIGASGGAAAATR